MSLTLDELKIWSQLQSQYISEAVPTTVQHCQLLEPLSTKLDYHDIKYQTSWLVSKKDEYYVVQWLQYLIRLIGINIKKQKYRTLKYIGNYKYVSLKMWSQQIKAKPNSAHISWNILYHM